MATVVIPSATQQISYADLYARWEAGNWQSTTIDFTQDKEDWAALTDQQRRGMLWVLASFFHGEDSVADNLSPFIDAAPTEEQTYFLTTQQVDESRHSVFFNRFMTEVIGLGDGTAGGGLAATDPYLNWGHRKTFAFLDKVTDELRRDRSKVQLARAVTMYHIIVEASLAQPGQHVLEDTLERLDIMPGFRQGLRHVANDEQRHIAFGVKLLSDLLAEDPDTMQEAILGLLTEVLPNTIGMPMPPGMDRSYTESLGFTIEDLIIESSRSNEAKLRAIGLPIDDIPKFPIPIELTHEQRAEQAVRMWTAGYVGPRDPSLPISRDPENIAAMFNEVRRNADSAAVAPGTTIQWDFTDSEPWFLSLNNGSTAVKQGRAVQPDLTLKLGFEDWVDVIAGRTDPTKLLLRRKLRPSGDLRVLLKLPKVFG